MFWYLNFSDFNIIFIHKYSLIFYLLIIHGILNTFLSGNDDESKTDTISHLQHLLNKFYNKNVHPIFRWYVCKREGVIDVGDDPSVRRKPHLQAETEHTTHIKMQWAILWKLARFFLQKCHPTLNFSIIYFFPKDSFNVIAKSFHPRKFKCSYRSPMKLPTRYM